MAIEVTRMEGRLGTRDGLALAAGGELKLGAQLVVTEKPVAVFFRDGKALDTFRPGRHTLTTANVPLLNAPHQPPVRRNLPVPGRRLLFVARKVFTDLKWGRGSRSSSATREPRDGGA